MREGRQRAVVLLSGGMDSCVCAALAARDYEPFALHVMYGQRTEGRERRAFEGICERLGIRRRMVVRNEVLRQVGGSALTDSAIAVPDARESSVFSRQSSAPENQSGHRGPSLGRKSGGLAQDESHQKPISQGADHPITGSPDQPIPITYVPFRNAHFLAAAVSWAEVMGAEKILIGAVEQDSSGYPDCRPAYYRAFNEVIRTGTKEGKIEIVTPLIGLRKAEIVRLGLELGAPFDLTWSCYSQEEEACGVCESCALRLRAFTAAGARDPIAYAAGVK